jgi:hypothetical protein
MAKESYGEHEKDNEVLILQILSRIYVSIKETPRT